MRGASPRRVVVTIAALVCALATASTAHAAGFAINEKGAKATAIGGAFVATADDLSAMYYNPAGLAQTDKLTAFAGGTVIPYFASFEGANPYPGQGYGVDMKQQTFVLPQFYVAAPVAKGFTVALGAWAPFGLSTAWEDPDNFRGRFLSQRVDLRQFAVGLQAAYQVTDWLSIGAGPELRIGDVKLQRNVGALNPFSNRFVDIAHADIVGEGFQSKVGWSGGLLLKPMPTLRLGASYHSAVDVEFTGSATFYRIPTGNPIFDGLLSSRLPFDAKVPASVTIQFPGVAQFGVAYDLGSSLTLEVNADYTNWSVFDKTVLNFDTTNGIAVPSSTLPHNWENTWAYRGGLEYKFAKGWFGLGFLYDKSPQPDEDVSPLLPDANRAGYSIGVGFKMGANTMVELANLALFFHERTTSTNHDNFSGTYKTFADLIVLNLKTSF